MHVLVVTALGDYPPMIQPEAIDIDAELEQRIAYQAKLIHSAPTRDERLAAWEVLKELHAQRSPTRVEQMERDQGLHARS